MTVLATSSNSIFLLLPLLHQSNLICGQTKEQVCISGTGQFSIATCDRERLFSIYIMPKDSEWLHRRGISRIVTQFDKFLVENRSKFKLHPSLAYGIRNNSNTALPIVIADAAFSTVCKKFEVVLC